MVNMTPISGPQAFDFYSALSGLGDTLQKNAALRQAQEKDDARKAAFSTLDPNSKDFGQIATAGAVNLLKTGDTEGGLHMLTLAQAQNQRDQAQANADRLFKQNDQHWNADHALAVRRADQADDETPNNFTANPKFGQPGEPKYSPIGPADPAYVKQKALAEAAAEGAPNKPIPFETLGGTKFLLRQPNGTFSAIDPQSLVSPQPSPQPQPVQPQPAIQPQPGGGPSGAPIPPAVSDGAPSAQPVPAPQPGPQAAQPADLDAVDPQTGRRENWLKAQSPDVRAYIKKISDYEIDPRTTSIKGGHREQVLSAVAQYDPTYDQNTFGSRSKAIKDFSTGAQGNSIRSFDVATDHLDTLQKYVEAAKNGDYRIINSLRQKWLQETGSPLPTNIQAVAPIVGAEVSKAIIGSNNALADREELRKPLNSANSPDQLMGAIQAYKSLMTGQLKGLGKQYEDTTGKKDFNNRLRENTRSILLGGADSGSPAPPKVGDVQQGHRYNGGNPADPNSWTAVQ